MPLKQRLGQRQALVEVLLLCTLITIWNPGTSSKARKAQGRGGKTFVRSMLSIDMAHASTFSHSSLPSNRCRNTGELSGGSLSLRLGTNVISKPSGTELQKFCYAGLIKHYVVVGIFCMLRSARRSAASAARRRLWRTASSPPGGDSSFTLVMNSVGNSLGAVGLYIL